MTTDLKATKARNQEIFEAACADARTKFQVTQEPSPLDVGGVIEAGKKQFGLSVSAEQAAFVWAIFDGNRSTSNRGRYGEAVADMGNFGDRRWMRPIK